MSPTARNQDGTQKYVALANRLGNQIESGLLKPGDRLPSLVDLRQHYGASQPTAERAYAILEREGLIVRKPNRGVFVADWQQARRQYVLGVAMPTQLYGLNYYERIIRGIQAFAQEEKVELLFLHESSELRWEKLDGVILASASRALFDQLPQGMPAVSLIQPLRSGISVTADDLSAVKGLVDHLLALGHRRIGYVTCGLLGMGDEVFYPDVMNKHRLQGYIEAMRAAGIEPDPQWVRPLRQNGEPMRRFEDMGKTVMTDWLNDGFRNLGCTALLAQNDQTAVGMIEALHEAGYRIPEDLSVVGFDGLDIMEYFRPRLTTAEVPLEEIGREGARFLLERVRMPLSALRNVGAREAEVHRCYSRIKIGDSSGPCPSP